MAQKMLSGVTLQVFTWVRVKESHLECCYVPPGMLCPPPKLISFTWMLLHFLQGGRLAASTITLTPLVLYTSLSILPYFRVVQKWCIWKGQPAMSQLQQMPKSISWHVEDKLWHTIFCEVVSMKWILICERGCHNEFVNKSSRCHKILFWVEFGDSAEIL